MTKKSNAAVFCLCSTFESAPNESTIKNFILNNFHCYSMISCPKLTGNKFVAYANKFSEYAKQYQATVNCSATLILVRVNRSKVTLLEDVII